MKTDEFTKFHDADKIEDVPFDISELREGELWLVKDGWRGYRALAFYCPCGCGGFHMIPVYTKGVEEKPNFCAWEIIQNGDKVTLNPSLLNGCKAHFFLIDNKVVWC